jgi:molybdopterin molybdotransferase
MSLFLSVVPVEKALIAVRDIGAAMPEERLSLMDAHDRILSADVSANTDIPGFSRSVVDGYAVVAADTTGASEAIPAILRLRGKVAMGIPESPAVDPGGCVYVPTGGILPEGANAVAMVEYSEEVGDDVLVHRPLAPGENMVARGEDFRSGEVVVHAGTRLSPRDLGVLAAIGCAKVPVSVPPRIGILSTGNELVPVSEVPGPAQVRDANSYLCSAFVRERGGIPVPFGIVPDDREALKEHLERALNECDAVLLSGGSSKDERDICAATIADMGEVLIHGIAIAPGKPTIIGRARGKPVIGLPGHPASAFVVLMVIVNELMRAMTGERTGPRTVAARLAAPVPSARGREDYVRVAFAEGMAIPLFGKSGLLNTLVKSKGVIKVPASREGLEPGEEVEVILW